MVKLSRFLKFFSASFLRLSELYANNNLSYSAMNTARFALSLVIFPLEGCTFGIHPLVCRLLKGIFTKQKDIIATISLCVRCSDRAKDKAGPFLTYNAQNAGNSISRFQISKIFIMD